MSPDQYTDLVGFLGEKFESIDRQLAETRRRATVLFEQARDERRSMMESFDARLKTVIGDHERRLQALEGS